MREKDFAFTRPEAIIIIINTLSNIVHIRDILQCNKDQFRNGQKKHASQLSNDDRQNSWH